MKCGKQCKHRRCNPINVDSFHLEFPSWISKLVLANCNLSQLEKFQDKHKKKRISRFIEAVGVMIRISVCLILSVCGFVFAFIRGQARIILKSNVILLMMLLVLSQWIFNSFRAQLKFSDWTYTRWTHHHMMQISTDTIAIDTRSPTDERLARL